jgi:hypothetical protein
LISNQQPTPDRGDLLFIDESQAFPEDHVTAGTEFSCPPARTKLSANPDFSVSAGKKPRNRTIELEQI